MGHYDLQQKRNFKLVLEYDGSGYHGWQRQEGVLTIQEILESRIEIMLGDPIRVRGSGRTDAGVHARRQVANFYARTRLKPQEIQRGLNSLLPSDIVVLEAAEVADSFHARFSAISKTYEYRILNRETPSALERANTWQIRQPLMAQPIRECLQGLIGFHDFSAFMAAGSSVKTTERNMYRAEMICSDPEHWVLLFEANGFLRHMVRNLVGTLVDVGRGKLGPEAFFEIMSGRDRRRAGMTAPAHGLFLVDVRYDSNDVQDIRKGWRMKLAERVTRIQPSATLAINAKAKALKAKGVHIVNFGVGEPDFDTPEHIQEAAIRAIKDGHTRYTAVGGIDELKDAVLNVIRDDYGLSYQREEVLVSCGGKHALYNLFQALLDPGDEVIIPSPYWVSYPDMVVLTGAQPIIVPCSEEAGFKLRAEDLRAAITDRTRLLILNSPSNPTGAYYTPSELAALAEVLLPRENVFIVSDDIYYRILFHGQEWANIVMVEPKLQPRTFIVNGVSKTYCMTGWRIGYLLGDAAAIKAATKIQSQSTSNPTSIAQYASVAALREHTGVVGEMVKIFQDRSGYVLDRLTGMPGVTCPKPAGAFYVFPNFSHYYGRKAGDRIIQSSLDLADYLMESAHVAVVPGGAFGEDRCLRFSYALSMEDLKEGFDRVARALKALV